MGWLPRSSPRVITNLPGAQISPMEFFSDVLQTLEAENETRENIRNVVRELERTCRSIVAIMSQIHSSASAESVTRITAEAAAKMGDVRTLLTKLAQQVPADQYYRYNGMWSFTLQSAVFLAALTTYVQHERLITVPEVEQALGVPVSLNGELPNFHIGVEDLLHGMVSLTGELSRLAVNSVTYGDFDRPLRISKFVGDLYSGFQLLNLKNDALRKRFDSIKYDLKKIEEVVYDISVRGLGSKEPAAPAADSGPAPA
ncbi:Translin [Hyaloraphidium curvatum]|nr:Translin [Hyaloraphidium curvatum]